MRFGKSVARFDRRADRVEIQVLDLIADLDRALRVADRDVLKLPFAATRAERAPAVRASRGKILRGRRGSAHLDRAGQLGGDRRRDRTGGGADREDVRVGPAVPAQVEDCLARSVAGQLGLRAVRVEDPQLGDELRVVAAREQQHTVGSRCRNADRRSTRREPGSAPRGAPRPRGSRSRCPAPATSRIASPEPIEGPGLRYWSVVPRIGGTTVQSSRRSAISAATSASERPVRSIGCRLGILRIQVSWRRA